MRVDFGAILFVGDDAAAPWVGACCKGSAVDLSRAGINRMMVPEEDSVLDEPMEGGGMLFGDEIRPHAVPNNDDDMLGFARGPALTGYQTCESESEGNGAHEAK